MPSSCTRARDSTKPKKTFAPWCRTALLKVLEPAKRANRSPHAGSAGALDCFRPACSRRKISTSTGIWFLFSFTSCKYHSRDFTGLRIDKSKLRVRKNGDESAPSSIIQQNVPLSSSCANQNSNPPSIDRRKFSPYGPWADPLCRRPAPATHTDSLKAGPRVSHQTAS